MLQHQRESVFLADTLADVRDDGDAYAVAAEEESDVGLHRFDDGGDLLCVPGPRLRVVREYAGALVVDGNELAAQMLTEIAHYACRGAVARVYDDFECGATDSSDLQKTAEPIEVRWKIIVFLLDFTQEIPRLLYELARVVDVEDFFALVGIEGSALRVEEAQRVPSRVVMTALMATPPELESS